MFGNSKSENGLVKKLRKDLLNDLMQLVEISLIQTSEGKDIDAAELKSRLFEITKPTNSETNKDKLRNIDAFLSERNT